MSALSALFFAAGLICLIGGADILVRGASRLAALFGVSSLIIGLTVVAYGTGSPELAVAIRASTVGQVDLAVGNVVGSNIFNVLFILGLSALVRPLVVHDQLVRIDVPIMILASGLLFFLSLDGTIGTVDGLGMIAMIVGYTYLLLQLGRRQRALAVRGAIPINGTGGRLAWIRHLVYIGAGVILLVVGSRWLVNGAVDLASAFGVSELVIGLTIVAAGTSLPEVATSVVAGLRGERDIAVGNVVGSNIYNILAVLGAAALVSPTGLAVAPAALRFDIPVMVVVAIACLPIFFATATITRWEGAIFFGYWVAYTLYVILAASQHDMVDEYSSVMRWFVIPLTIITLAVVLSRAARGRNPRPG
ncbi:MAG TPA: calcium/sodium antiporter [Longimicrobiales bacterium]|nr:calcium/sodium antiporter [Longimicrobiales bacterium]